MGTIAKFAIAAPALAATFAGGAVFGDTAHGERLLAEIRAGPVVFAREEVDKAQEKVLNAFSGAGGKPTLSPIAAKTGPSGRNETPPDAAEVLIIRATCAGEACLEALGLARAAIGDDDKPVDQPSTAEVREVTAETTVVPVKRVSIKETADD
ncbi:MAG: hypothetical protein AAFX08_08080 [Pseudomonadota bacterium]